MVWHLSQRTPGTRALSRSSKPSTVQRLLWSMLFRRKSTFPPSDRSSWLGSHRILSVSKGASCGGKTTRSSTTRTRRSSFFFEFGITNIDRHAQEMRSISLRLYFGDRRSICIPVTIRLIHIPDESIYLPIHIHLVHHFASIRHS